MKNTVDQQVIDFTAAYTGTSPEAIDNSTTLVSLGIVTRQDCIDYIVNLEDSFDLQYQDGDEKGIETVGNAAVLIEKKLRVNSTD